VSEEFESSAKWYKILIISFWVYRDGVKEWGKDVIITKIEPVVPTPNGTTRFKNCEQIFELQHLLLLRNIWW
jgi:hypothetical protein